jgi:hypothetical protein
MKRHIEDSELQVVIKWSDYHWLLKGLLIHIENERKCNIVQGARRKSKGVRKGVPDLFLPLPANGYHGLWVEMKGPKNLKGYRPAPVTPEQKKWIEWLKSKGYAVYVCYGADEAIQVIRNYIGEPFKPKC